MKRFIFYKLNAIYGKKYFSNGGNHLENLRSTTKIQITHYLLQKQYLATAKFMKHFLWYIEFKVSHTNTSVLNI